MKRTNKKKRIISAVFALMLCCTSMVAFTGCGEKQTPEEIQAQEQEKQAVTRYNNELKQNDYRGGVQRCGVLKTSILQVMEDMKANNVAVREDNPNGFWNIEGYQDFVSTFLTSSIINDTQWFNEEEIAPDDPVKNWESTLSQMKNNKLSFTTTGDGETPYVFMNGVEVLRREKDDYSVTNVPFKFYLNDAGDETYEGKMGLRILYDCDKDWCKAYGTATQKEVNVFISPQMFEFMRIDNDTFAIQTERERVFIKLKPVEGDVDIREREVAEFYYSKLVADGMRTTFKPYIPLPEYDEVTMVELKSNKDKNKLMADNIWLNEEGDIATMYGKTDSLFYRTPSEITADNFVFEDKALQQAICYKDGVLVATTYNKLSTEYEQFTYSLASADKKIIEELENKVQIKNLIGGSISLADEFLKAQEKEQEKLKEKEETATTETTTTEKNEVTEATSESVGTENAEQVSETTITEETPENAEQETKQAE